jgi:hypothetical protein
MPIQITFLIFTRKGTTRAKDVILFPRAEDRIGESTGELQTRERLGGMLKFYYREAA